MEELVTSHGKELTEEELEAIIIKAFEEEEEEVVVRPILTVYFLGEVLQDTRAEADRVQDVDSVMEQNLQFKRGLDDILLPYKELHRNLQHSAKQLYLFI